MQYRRFGNTGLVTSEVGFGCARIGGVFGGHSQSEIVALLRRAFDAGITFFDTADMYTQGESERLVGQAFHRDRDRVLLATKFGYRLPAQKQLINWIKPLVRPLVTRLGLRSQQIHAGVRGTVSQQDFSSAYIVSAVESSLRRLKTDYIDIYQLHDPSPEVLDRGEFVEPLERLRQQGKIRFWGVACQQPEDALVSLRHATLDSIQVGLSALEQAALDAALPSAARRGAAIIARQVFASGLLTRQFEGLRLENIDHDMGVAANKLDQLKGYASIVERSGRSPAEMALQFALARQEVSVVLLGISRVAQLSASLRALRSAKLSPDEEALLLSCRRPGR